MYTKKMVANNDIGGGFLNIFCYSFKPCLQEDNVTTSHNELQLPNPWTINNHM